jgi:HK97 family phage major capsid protein
MLNLKEAYKKLEGYLNTAKNLHNSGFKNDNWFDTAKEADFLRVTNKAIDLQVAIKHEEDRQGEQHELPMIVDIYTVDSALEKLEEIRRTPVNDYIPAPVGNSSNGPFIKASEKKFIKMFGNTGRNSEFRDFKDFALAVRMKDSRRIRNATGGNEGNPSEGGFLVPSEFSSVFIDKTIEDSVMLPGCTIYPMISSKRIVPAWDSSNHSNGAFGGITAVWVVEGGSNNYQIPKSRQMELNCKKLVVLSSATQELAEDAPDYESNLQQGLSKATSWQFDDALINGNGTGKPLGILNSNSKVKVDKESGQAAATIIYNNICKMMARLHPSCWNSSVWLAHPSTLPQLLQLTIAVGAGGAPVTPSFNFENGSYMLMGRQVLFTEKCQQLGTEGDLILVDRTQYIVGMRKEIVMDVSGHVLFSTVEQAYRVVLRADGQPAWDEAVTPANGTDSLSWAVTLETR